MRAAMVELLNLVFLLLLCTLSDGKGSMKLGPCATQVMEHKNNPNAAIPSCKEDGSFKPTQCTSISVNTINYDRDCWCVNIDGNEIPGTRKKKFKGNLDCEDNIEGRMVEPVSSIGCAVKDRPRCKVYVNHEAYYCEQYWTRKFCKHLCGLCDRSTGGPTDIQSGYGGQGGAGSFKGRATVNQGGSAVTKSKPKIKQGGCPANHCRPSTTHRESTDPQGTTSLNRGGSLATHGKPITNRGGSAITEVFKCKNDHEVCHHFKKKAEHFRKQDWVEKNCENMCGLGCGSGDQSKHEQVFKCKKDHEVCPDFKKEAHHFCKQDWVKKNCENMCGLGCGSEDQSKSSKGLTASNQEGSGTKREEHGDNQGGSGSNRRSSGKIQDEPGWNQHFTRILHGGFSGHKHVSRTIQGGPGGNQGVSRSI